MLGGMGIRESAGTFFPAMMPAVVARSSFQLSATATALPAHAHSSPGAALTMFVRIAEYDAMLREAQADKQSRGDRAMKSFIKDLENRKAAREERLKALANRPAKDTQVWFEETGVDYLFVDEAHLFKNLETLTKLGALVGAIKPSQLATTSSSRSTRTSHRGPSS